jgi:hypothetical protein
MKVLLISPNLSTTPSPVYPIGLDYVAGMISPPHEVKIIDLLEKHSLESLAGLIRDFGPRLIGLSIRNVDNMEALETKTYVNGYQQLISAIREMTSAEIILGGSGFTIFPAELMEALDADYGIVGDGEPFMLLLHAVETHADASCIPGVMVKGKPFAGFPDSRESTFRRSFDVSSPHVQ